MTKAALLLVVGEPFNEVQTGLILDRIDEELQYWNNDVAKCELQKELDDLATSEEKSTSGNVVTHSSDGLSTTILFNPERRQLLDTLQNFLLLDSHYRHLVYAGQTIAGSGSWILQDDIFAFRDFVKILKEMDSVGVHGEGKGFALHLGLPIDWDWNKNNIVKLSNLGVKLASNGGCEKSQNFDSFRTYLSQLVTASDLKDVLKTSSTIGMINFTGPTLYIFPGGNGNSALFGIKDFTALIDGGYSRRSCSWDFSRHLHRIDVVMLTHLAANNFLGMQSFLERRAETGTPDVGSVFLNCPEKFKKPPVSTGLKVNLFQSGASLIETLNAVGLPPQSCYSPQPLQPIILYNKIGFGSIEMFVLSPIQSTEEMKNFLNQWSLRAESEHFSAHSGVPLSNTLSASILLVWKPFTPNGKIVRLLFPGGTTQAKLFDGLDRLKNIAVFEHMQCSQSDLSEKSGIFAKTSRAGPSRPVSLKPVASKVNGEEEKAKSANESKDVVAKTKEPPQAKMGTATRPTKLEQKKTEKIDTSMITSTPISKVESKPPAKASSPAKTSKETKATGKAVETLPPAKKPAAKANEVESSPKHRPNRMTPAEAVKQSKPMKLTEAVKQKSPEAKQPSSAKEQKTVRQTEHGKPTKAEATVHHAAVKQTKKETDKKQMRLELKAEKHPKKKKVPTATLR